MKKPGPHYLFFLILLTFISCQLEDQGQGENLSLASKMQGGTPQHQYPEKLQQIMASNLAHLISGNQSKCLSLFRHQTQLVTAAHCFAPYETLQEILAPKMRNNNLSQGAKKQIIKDQIIQLIHQKKNQLRVYQSLTASNYQVNYRNSLPIQTLLLPRLFGQALLYHLYHHFDLPHQEITSSLRGRGIVADFAYLSVNSNNPRYVISTITGRQLEGLLDNSHRFLPITALTIRPGKKYSYSKVGANLHLVKTPSYFELINDRRAFDTVIAAPRGPEQGEPGDSGAPYLFLLGGEYFLAGIHTGRVTAEKYLKILQANGVNRGFYLSMIVDDVDFWNLYDVVPYEQLFQ